MSNKAISKKITDETIKIAYFSGSITHNENFEMIKPALIKILEKFKNVELHLAGHLDIPADIEKFGNSDKNNENSEVQENLLEKIKVEKNGFLTKELILGKKEKLNPIVCLD